ncbi:hypothetical protein GCM10022406_25330 [Hymenobacter algoricola]|uniref:Phage integrase SAM-like domain-containing protein n=1 Tax=Hymenobacter algoricola TaxID=486267 RepID=A0ABP7N8W8_9BACT
MHKFTLHVYLRRPDKAGTYATRMVAYFHGTDFSVSPGVRILPGREERGRKPEKLWDPDTMRVTAAHPDADVVNERLAHWEGRLRDAFRKLSGPGALEQVTRPAMEAELFPTGQAKKQRAIDPRTLSFVAHYQQWVAENQGILKPVYLNKYKSVAKLLQQFRPTATAGDLDEKFVKDYLRELLKKGSSDATISREFKFLRIVGTRIGLAPGVKWLSYEENSAPQLDLHQEELCQLIRARMPTAALTEERDRWLLECFSGRRDADMAHLSAQQLETIDTAVGPITFLRHAQQKTTQVTLVPLPPMALAIGERYGWQLPVRSNQYRNSLIKQVAKEAGLTRVFNLMRISGGAVTNHYRPVHEIISTHTARHTCASLLLEGSDGDKSLANFVLGHTNKDITDRYAKDKVKRVAPKVLAAWQQVLGGLYNAVPTW